MRDRALFRRKIATLAGAVVGLSIVGFAATASAAPDRTSSRHSGGVA